MTGACANPGGDGGNDGPGSDANSCWHGVAPSNFAPCDAAFPPATASFPFINGEVLDTSQGTLSSTGGPAPGTHYTFGSTDAWLLHFTSWTVGAGATFNVSGTIPLLVVSDGDVSIEGTINVLPTTTAAPDCAGLDGGTLGFSGAGGAGGGYGATGGGGGANSDGSVPGTPGGAARGNATIIPLIGGCAGGPGGNGGAANHAGRMGLGADRKSVV